MGIDPDAPAITYCDSHLRPPQTGQWFVQYELLGNKQVKQYDGSMHEWTKNEANPVTAMKSE